MAETRIVDGTSQQDRNLPALEEGYIHVDEMGFADLLAMAADYARMLVLYDVNHRPDGDWECLFTADEAIIMAMILTTDLERIEADFSRYLEGPSAQFSQPDDVRALPTCVLAKQIDFWLSKLRVTQGAASQRLEQKIEDLIQEKLGRELQKLVRFLTPYNRSIEDIFRQDYSRFWFYVHTEERSHEDIPSPESRVEQINQFLKSNFYVFYHAMTWLQEHAENLLYNSMKSEIHSPAIGLYIAFVKLFQHVRQKLNGFTQRHLQFYYHDVLKTRPRSPVPDSTYLLFRPDSVDKTIEIPAGTAFSAGVDEHGQEVIYTADNDLLVHSAGVQSLATLYFPRDPLSEPEHSLQWVTGAKVNRISLVAGDTAAGTARSAWPVVGAPKNDAEHHRGDHAAMGFAIASPVLFLKEGERVIQVALTLESRAPASQSLSDILEDIFDQLNIAGAERHNFFFKAFRHMFNISLTGETGWLEVKDYLPLSHVVDKSCENDQLKLYMTLPAPLDAIVGYDPDIHEEHYDTRLPVMRLMINPTSYLFPYGLLQDLIIKAVTIDVEVKGTREVLLYNNLGSLDANNPFYPFGPLPVVGSYLIVGHAEAARKQITGFDVDIEWGELPAETGGFAQYYQAYEMPFDNAIFEAGISVLADGQWQPEAEADQPRVTLFQSEDLDHPAGGWRRVDKKHRLSCDRVVRHLKPIEGGPVDHTFAYSTQAKDGFVKLTLAHPPHTFGHKAYPLLLANVLTANARLKNQRFAKPVPNAPYTPLIHAIAVHYRARSSIDLDRITSTREEVFQEKLFHIHPFGLESLSRTAHRHIAVVPQYSAAGYLFIGLAAQALAGVLTLFFHLRDDSTPQAGTGPSELQWAYLTSNHWKPLARSQVISDTTQGFLSSGIVTLAIPADINRGNTAMPDHLFWLRVAVAHHPEVLCSAYAVHTQALKVSRQSQNAELAYVHHPLPAGRITAPRVSIPGIASVTQMIDAFGGRAPENAGQIKRRLNERLKHKNRASTAWDYERLILEQFPEIVKVKCFAHMVDAPEPAERSRPGAVLIVVIPELKDQVGAHLRPRANGFLLRAIEAYVRNLASPFVHIKVRNPAYEQIQIRCTVKFSLGAGDGYHVKALNQAITDYLSPWNPTGYRSQFGWLIRRYDLESYIRNLDYIDGVTNFSMLHIVEERPPEEHRISHYHLYDTARAAELGAEEISPVFPWSIAISVRQHFIETMHTAALIQPEITGIDELELGRTFILSGNRGNGKEK